MSRKERVYFFILFFFDFFLVGTAGFSQRLRNIQNLGKIKISFELLYLVNYLFTTHLVTCYLSLVLFKLASLTNRIAKRIWMAINYIPRVGSVFFQTIFIMMRQNIYI